MTSSPGTTTAHFGTVLVANRGEIACRIIGTLRRLGVRSVAVYSDADRAARHVALADVAVLLGPAEPRLSYLDVEAVVAAAQQTGAEAIHPGYGFLSENPDLARACAAAGIVFVGPGVEALEIMGDKIRAKEHVTAAGVPTIHGVARPGLSDADLVAAAADVGYPLLIKPSAGGGGKGMHVVEDPAELPDALVAARRVARAAFGDDNLLLERYLRSPRHIEVQVLADNHGSVIHLGERECSLQRRHQKVIEEAPSPLLDDAVRARIGAAACEVARSVRYVGAGTVEFLVPDDAPDDFSFIEMNTRLQVEHPVTEMITGIDLVEHQLAIAAGEPLGLTQDDVHLRGHAVEARLYAENPARGFLPASGTVLVLDEPSGPGLRVDSSLDEGSVVGSRYDPMLAKVVAWGTDRAQALARLDAALAATTVLGVHTNVAFLRQVLADPEVRAGRLDTGLLERLLPRMTFAEPDRAVLTAAALWVEHAPYVGATSPSGRRGRGPWRQDGWRLGEHAPLRHSFATGSEPGATKDVVVRSDGTVAVGDQDPVHAALVVRGPDTADVETGGTTRRFRLARDGDVLWVGSQGSVHALTIRDRAARLAAELAAITREDGQADPEVRAPMPGTVVAVDVTDGEHVRAGQPLLTIEAMKMEHRITSPTGGIVTISARPADLVRLDQVVATITPHPDDGTPTDENPHEGNRG